MKKVLALVLSAVMLLALAACNQTPANPTVPQGTNPGDPAGTTEPMPTEALVRANAVTYCPADKLTGDFSGGLFFGGSGDSVVADLAEDASLYIADADGSIALNPRVVADQMVNPNEDGTLTYTFTLRSDLCYSNGERVTAGDYAARLLFVSSPAADAAGAGEGSFAAFVGGKEYHAGRSACFAGVRVVDEMTLELTLNGNYAGYYHLDSLFLLKPWHVESWLGQTLSVDDDGDGACFVRANAVCQLTADDVAHAKKAASFGYGSLITAGAYKIIAFDAASGTAELTRNAAYSGTPASIERITVSSDRLPDAFTQVIPGADAPGDLVSAAGYTSLSFTCDATPTQFMAVRQAIARLIDRPALIAALCPDYGTAVNGPYCTSLWQYAESREVLMELETYDKNLNAAIALLEEDGWVYDAKGGAWIGDGPRYKQVSDAQAAFAEGCVEAGGKILMPLTIRYLTMEGSAVGDALEQQLTDPKIESIGIRFVRDSRTGAEVSALVQRQANVSAWPSMVLLNTAFTAQTYDNAFRYDAGSAANITHLVDTGDGSLSQIAKYMNFLTARDDTEGYLALWQQYVARCNALLPELPLYGNISAVCVPEFVTGYEASPFYSFAQSILHAEVQP